MKTTVGQLLINEILPPELRDYNRPISKKEIQKLLREVASKYPTQYNDISKALMDLGGEVATVYGREASISLNDLRIGPKAHTLRKRLQTQIATILDSKESDEAKNQKITKLVGDNAQTLRDMNFKEQLELRNALAMQVNSGARGNPVQFSATNVGDLLVQDHRDNVIPIPLLNSYSEGLDPVEYWAGSYGARKGMVDLKFATPKGGFLGKQLSLAAHRLIVTEDDCGTKNGIPVDADDVDNVGAVLARDSSGVTAGSIIDMKSLKKFGKVDEIIVRSALTCQARDGVCAQCVGVREKGKLPEIGDNVGITAAQAISEPITQSAISSKHCLARGTQVRMADYSTKAIEDISIDDMVLGADHVGATFPSRVVNVYNNGERDCIATTLQLNQSKDSAVLESTAEHKVLVRQQVWDGKATRKGGTGNFVWQYGLRPIGTSARSSQLLIPRSFTATGLKNEPRALLLGLLLGDGCYTKAVHGVHFSCADNSLVFELSAYMSSLNLRFKLLQGQTIYYRISSLVEVSAARDATTGRVLPGARNPAVVMLQEFGAEEKYAHEKVIPDEVYDWDNASVAELLAGLFITDGSVYLGNNKKHMHVAFGVTSQRMVTQVRELLAWRFGIYGGICINNYGGRKRPVYYLKIANMESVRRFIDAIPLRGVKRRKVERWHDRLNHFACRNINRRIVKSQKPIGLRETYDIAVDNVDHLFVLANGAIVSNSGGVAGAGPTAGGFDAINQLVQVPKTFKGGAAIANVDGIVNSIEKAPQGGSYIGIAGERHYVAPEFDPLVAPGDKVEAGDVISEGLANPSEIVRHKGIGAGRWHFMKVFRNTLRDSKISANRRNVELLSRGLINHARVTEEDGPNDTLPDDIVEFSTLTRGYKPRRGTQKLQSNRALGMYLEEPVLQYSIGSKITPRTAADMQKHGVTEVQAHQDVPSFEPEMVRAMDVLSYNDDWQVRLGGFHLKKNLLESVHRGRGTEEHSTSFIPSLAKTIQFGKAPVKPGEAAGAKY